jgi:hypothetical protein
MKYIKVLAVAVVALFAFEGAKAQVVVQARVGAPVVHTRTVVVNRPVYHRRHHRTVVVNRPYHRSHYRRTVVVNRPVHHRHHSNRVVVVRR